MTTPENNETVGKALCAVCDERKEVDITEFGLICESCDPVVAKQNTETYIPNPTGDQDDWAEEASENVEQFNEELPDIGFDIPMDDGSTYEMDKHDAHAVLLKHGDDWKQFCSALILKTKEHFEKQTEPTKFTDHASWGSSNIGCSKKSYDTHAELAPVVAYPALRGAKMQLAFMAMSGDEDNPDEEGGVGTPNVISISETSIDQYSEHGRITLDTTDLDELDDPEELF